MEQNGEIIKQIGAFVLRWMSYGLVSYLAISLLLPIMYIFVAITGGDFSFLKDVTPFGSGTFSFGLDFVIKIFLALSTIIFIIVQVAKYVIKKFGNTEIKISFVKKMGAILIFTSAIYLTVMLIYPSFVFIIFYVMAIVSSFGYFGLNFLADSLLNLTDKNSTSRP